LVTQDVNIYENYFLVGYSIQFKWCFKQALQEFFLINVKINQSNQLYEIR